MLTDEQRSLLVKYYQTVQLTGVQKDRLIQKYWEANVNERKEIAQSYAHLFAMDAGFVQRLMLYHDLHKGSGIPSSNSHNISSGKGSLQPDKEESGGQGVGSPFSVGSASSSFSAAVAASPAPSRRLTHAQCLLRTAIHDQFPKLAGPGPYSIRFGLVKTEPERKEIIDLYASRFEHPDPSELQKLVTLPYSLSTRTRKRFNGSYSWYIRCESTADVVCAVTVTAHHHQTHRFVEMPLFATAVGYKNNGFGRLLNAALASWCQREDFEFIMISADVQAIPFWKVLGYEIMSKSELNGIAFFYEHECYKFIGAEPMIGYCRHNHNVSTTRLSEAAAVQVTGSSNKIVTPLCDQRVGDAMQKMPKFVLTGATALSDV